MPTHFHMRRLALRAEFRHVAEHRHAPALQRQIASLSVLPYPKPITFAFS